MLRILLTLIITVCFIPFCYSQSPLSEIDAKLVAIQPTGIYVSGYPLMKRMDTSSIECRNLYHIAENSAIKGILELYDIAQNYLLNLGRLDAKAPAFLALTENEGGYARAGFYLLTDDGDTLRMKETRYVDIKISNISGDINRLMSFTQLYPHELGHIIYSMVALNEYVDPEYRNVDMHYFPVITDYSTAFNEGFAEQFENISRLTEENDSIRAGFENDVERIERYSEQCISGYIRDFCYPTRLGFYKSSVIYWFQKYEDYRRYVHATHPDIKYIYTSPDLGNIEDRLSIRNAGIMKSSRIKNSVQLMSTEGFVTTFFTQVLMSDLPFIYNEMEFYRLFLPDTSIADFVPEEVFSPMQNQFIKYFYVLHHYVSKWNSDKNQFADFFEAYIRSFPKEEHFFLEIYKSISGMRFNHDIPGQLWLMAKNHDHRVLAIDPFGAITMPVYTFDLNAAEIEDLLCLNGMNRDMAQSIIDYRETKGLFRSIDDLKNANGISEEAIELIIDSKFDKEYFNSLDETELSFSKIIYTPVKYLLLKSGIYLLILLIILNIIFLRRKKSTISQRLWISMSYTFRWILLFALVCAIVLMTSKPVLFTILTMLLAMILAVIPNLKNKTRLRRSFFMSLLMSLVLLLSVI